MPRTHRTQAAKPKAFAPGGQSTQMIVGADGAERKKEMQKWDKTDDELLEKLKKLTPEQRKKLISKL